MLILSVCITLIFTLFVCLTLKYTLKLTFFFVYTDIDIVCLFDTKTENVRFADTEIDTKTDIKECNMTMKVTQPGNQLWNQC